MFEVVILTVIPQLTQDEFEALLPHVSLEKQELIMKFNFKWDAQNCLLGDVLARIEICRATSLSNKQLEFSVNSYGKPLLINRPHFHFNISHTGHYVACALADESVGIDIELIKPVDLRIAERFFASDEIEYIMADEASRFFEVWTKKESRIKWEGTGLHKPLASFSVFDFDEHKQPIYHKIFQNDDVIGHVCSTKLVMPSVRMMDTAGLMRCVI